MLFFLLKRKEEEKKTKKMSLKIGQGVGASWWRVCYQLGLTRLVLRGYDLLEKVKERKKLGKKEHLCHEMVLHFLQP